MTKRFTALAMAVATVVAFGIGTWCHTDASANQQKPVASWEHLALSTDAKHGLGDKKVSGQIVQLGRDGWQLVDVEAFITPGEESKTVYYFKRPR